MRCPRATFAKREARPSHRSTARHARPARVTYATLARLNRSGTQGRPALRTGLGEVKGDYRRVQGSSAANQQQGPG